MPSLLARAKARLRKQKQPHNIPSTFLLLPLEIRLLIYTQLLGDRTIHIKISKIHFTPEWRKLWFSKSGHRCIPWGSLTHRVCISQWSSFMIQEVQGLHESESLRGDELIGPDLFAPHYWCTHKSAELALDLRILRTCRQVYDEAKLIPYHTNTFAFDSSDALDRFCVGSFSYKHYLFDQPCHAFKTPPRLRPTKKRLLFARKGPAYLEGYPLTALVPSPIHEIRRLKIHAAYRSPTECRMWNAVCHFTAHLWSGLKHLDLSIELTPDSSISDTVWLRPHSMADGGFRAYFNAPLRSVSVEVSDHQHHPRTNSLGRRGTTPMTIVFAEGIRNFLLDRTDDEN
jgi:hypothetical protein